MKNEPTWHVVTSQGSIILGVFGEALLSHAQECAREVRSRTGFASYVLQVKGERPKCGQHIQAYRHFTSEALP